MQQISMIISDRIIKGLVKIEQYRTGNLAISIKNHVLTVYVDGLGINEVAISDYSEYQGAYNELLRLEVIKIAHRYQRSGYVNLPICYLNPNYKLTNKKS